MKWRLFIPFVNRRDLLEQALRSIRISPADLIVIDNSDHRVLYGDETFRAQHNVICAPVPLFTAQTMNYIIGIANSLELDVFFYMHNDAEVVGNGFQDFLSLIPGLPNNWGVAFTNYDTLVAFNMMAVRKVGLWDWVRFPQYFADTDYYHRVRLSGFETIWVDIEVIHHGDGSNTIRSDKARMHIANVLSKAYYKLYRHKWGGKPEHERLVEPRMF